MKVSLADIFKETAVPSKNVWAFYFQNLKKLEMKGVLAGKGCIF